MIAVRGLFNRRPGATNEGTGTRGLAGWLRRRGFAQRAGRADVKPARLLGELGGRRSASAPIQARRVIPVVDVSRAKVPGRAPRGV